MYFDFEVSVKQDSGLEVNFDFEVSVKSNFGYWEPDNISGTLIEDQSVKVIKAVIKGDAIVESLSVDREELQRYRRVNAATTADSFMNYTSADRSRMVSHIIPVSGVRKNQFR